MRNDGRPMWKALNPDGTRPSTSIQPQEFPLNPMPVKDRNIEKQCGYTSISNVVLRCYQELSPAVRCTYALLKSYAYNHQSTFVSQALLAELQGISERSVRTHIGKLEEVGLITIERRGLGKTNIYYFEDIPEKRSKVYLKRWAKDKD